MKLNQFLDKFSDDEKLDVVFLDGDINYSLPVNYYTKKQVRAIFHQWILDCEVALHSKQPQGFTTIWLKQPKA